MRSFLQERCFGRQDVSGSKDKLQNAAWR